MKKKDQAKVEKHEGNHEPIDVDGDKIDRIEECRHGERTYLPDVFNVRCFAKACWRTK